ncbi:MAG: hypothetical protein WBK08_01060 [Nitrospira sp.]|jgi:uncharacterized protein involved in exopolysaccharide biosynthesis
MNTYTLFDYWYVLYRKRSTIGLIVLFAIVFAVGLSWLLPSIYQPQTVFFIPSKPDSLTFYSENSAGQVARVLLIPEAKGEQQKVYLGMLESASLRERVHEMFPQKSIRELKRDVDFETGSDFLLKVYVRDKDASVAADIANAYVQLFDETLSGYSLQATERKQVELENQLVDTRAKLSNARTELASFQKSNKLTKVEEKSEGLTKYRQELEKEIEDLKVKIKQTEQRIVSIQAEFAKESVVFSESEVALSSNAIVENLQKQLSDLESQIARARSRYTESHQEVVTLRAQYNLKRRDLEEEIKQVIASGTKAANTFIESLRQDLVRSMVEKETLTARVHGLIQAMENVDRQIAAVPFMQTNYEELSRGVEQYQRLAQNLEKTIAEITAQRNHDLKTVVVIDRAVPPKNPIFPDPFLNTLVAIGLGLVGGIFYAFLIDYSERMSLGISEDLKELELEMVQDRRSIAVPQGGEKEARPL